MYRITIPAAATVGKEPMTATVEELLKSLQRYGYKTEFQHKSGALVCQISVTAAEEEVFSIKDRLTPDAVMSLSRFVERASVQNALNDMFGRMVSIGWRVSLKEATILVDEKIEVERSDGTTKSYSPTNAEMVRLRHDLDHAETHWIIGDKMDLFLEAGWEVQEASDGGYYILFKPNGDFETVTFGRVDQAKAAVKSAEEVLAAAKASALADQTAERLGL